MHCPGIGAADSQIDRGRQRPSGDGKQRPPEGERARPSGRWCGSATRCCTVEQAPYRAPAFSRTCCPKGVHGLPCHRWRQRLAATQSGQSKSARCPWLRRCTAAVHASSRALCSRKSLKAGGRGKCELLAALFARSLQLASGGPPGLGPLQRGLSPRRAPAESPRAGWHWSLLLLCNDRRHATGRRRCGAMVWTGPQIGSCNGVRLGGGKAGAAARSRAR
jgi:hypothetical protein